MKIIFSIFLGSFLLFSFFKSEDYVTVSDKKTKVIISAPHGGKMKPLGLKNRNEKNGIYTEDKDSKFIALEISKNKSYVIANLHRRKLDFNRPAPKDQRLAEIWNSYHNILILSKDKIIVDIHSHNNDSLIHIGGIDANFNRVVGNRLNQIFKRKIAYPSDGVNKPNQYFDGGYITRAYSKNGNRVIQLEIPEWLRGKNKQYTANKLKILVNEL